MKPGYKQTEIGVIPEDWEVKFLTAFGAVVSGGTPSTSVSEYWDGDIAWCTPSDITKTAGTTIAKTERCITAKGLFNSAAVLLPPGCVLLCTRATIGDSKINSVAMATNQGFKNIVPKNCNISFLFYLLQTKKQQMLEKAIGSTFLEISKSALCSIPMQYPPIPEQQRIAEALSDVDELIASLEKLIEKKKAIKQGVMQELLTGKRRLPGFCMPWILVNISDLAEIYSGGTPDTSNSDYWGGSIPWMNSGELNLKIVQQVQGRITQRGYENSSTHYIPAFCVLIGLAGQGKTRGTAAYNTFPLCTNQSIAAIYPNPKVYDSKFLYYMMDVRYDKLRELSSGDGGRGGLTKNLLLNYSLTIPKDVEEQRAIAAIMTAIDNEIMSLEAKLTKAQQIKQGMMQRLLTGAIRLI